MAGTRRPSPRTVAAKAAAAARKAGDTKDPYANQSGGKKKSSSEGPTLNEGAQSVADALKKAAAKKKGQPKTGTKQGTTQQQTGTQQSKAQPKTGQKATGQQSKAQTNAGQQSKAQANAGQQGQAQPNAGQQAGTKTAGTGKAQAGQQKKTTTGAKAKKQSKAKPKGTPKPKTGKKTAAKQLAEGLIPGTNLIVEKGSRGGATTIRALDPKTNFPGPVVALYINGKLMNTEGSTMSMAALKKQYAQQATGPTPQPAKDARQQYYADRLPENLQDDFVARRFVDMGNIMQKQPILTGAGVLSGLAGLAYGMGAFDGPSPEERYEAAIQMLEQMPPSSVTGQPMPPQQPAPQMLPAPPVMREQNPLSGLRLP